jgi:hypothetical protein
MTSIKLRARRESMGFEFTPRHGVLWLRATLPGTVPDESG